MVTSRGGLVFISMMKISKLMFSALVLLPLAGCLDEEEGIEDELPETTAAASCSGVQPSDVSVSLDPHETYAVSGTPDGSSSCAAFSVSYDYVNEVKAQIKYGTYAPVFNPLTCAAQRITMQLWTTQNSLSGWTPIPGSQKSSHGTWISLTGTCLQPSVSYESGNDSIQVLGEQLPIRIIHQDVRVQVETSGVSSNKLPVKVTGTHDTELI